MTIRTPRRRGQDGLTLVELIVTTFVLGIVSAITLAAFLSGSNTLGRVDDDVRGQGDQRLVSERLIGDLRQARGIDNPKDPASTSTPPALLYDPATELRIWIDSNANYQREPQEIVTWKLSLNAADAEKHFDVLRVQNGHTETVARALVNGIAFAYSAAGSPTLTGTGVAQASVVKVTMEYDAIVGNYLQRKKTTFDARLRNVT